MGAKKRIGKRWVAFVLLISIVLSGLPNRFAMAAMKEMVFQGEGYQVEFRITSQWDTGANGEITITNTGEAVLENWAISFPFPYTIEQIWNGQVAEHQEDWYMIKNVGWNKDIPIGGCVRFGFALHTDQEILPPIQYHMPSGKENVHKNRYKVTYQVASDWGSGFEGRISITNGPEKAIKDWELSFDLEEELTNVWDGKILSREENHYVIGNAGYNAVIEPNQTVVLGFTGTNNQGGKPLQVSLYESNTELPADSSRDTDRDGIPDAVEREIGTNPFLSDTDGDGLEDGYESIQLRTDPTKADTDGNGVLDGDEDFDQDGLTNGEERKLQTNPHSADTDLDELTDWDERFLYKTDPLKEDTDGDGIHDGDEVALGLDPLSLNTHGVPDKEYTFEQTVSGDVLEEINEDNPYELKIDVKAAGVADHVLTVEESGYTQLLSDNTAIFGKVVDLDYGDLMVEEASLKFRIDDNQVTSTASNYTDPGLDGIKRFQVFRYDESKAALCPVETTFDEKSQICQAQTEELGTYCLIDMDQWLYDLGMPEEGKDAAAEPAFFAQEETIPDIATGGAVSPGMEEAPPEDILPKGYEESKINEILERYGNQPALLSEAKEYHKQIDLVFLVDTSGSMYGSISKCKNSMKTLVKNLYEAGITARVAVLSFDDYSHEIQRFALENGQDWGKNPEEALQLISQVSMTNGWQENHVDALKEAVGLKFRSNTTRFAVMLTDEPLTSSDNHSDLGASGIADKLKSQGIVTSVVCRNADLASFQPIFTKTDGIQISISSNFAVVLETFIETVMRENTRYTAVLPNTLSTVALEKSPTKLDTATDSDGDGLPDSQEINWNYIREDAENLFLPTLYEYISYDLWAFSRLSDRNKEFIHSILVLPILSNPASKDSDHDGYDDGKDKKPLVNSIKEYSLKRKEYVDIYYYNEEEKKNIYSYGGNQGWFDDSDWFSEDYILSWYGCGTIAIADTFLYWALQDGNKNTDKTKMCLDESPKTKDTYLDYVRIINSKYTNTPRWLGVIGPDMAAALQMYSFKSKFDYRASWKFNLSDQDMEQLIVKMLNNDMPVIFSVGPNTQNLSGDKEVSLNKQIKRGDAGYDSAINALYQYKPARSTKGHYMTITGIIYDENTENKNEAIMLHISSWGEEYYISYKEYREYVHDIGDKFTSSLLYVK